MKVRILVGDVRVRLLDLPDASVHCVVTSPPYYGLRDYGVSGQIGLEKSPEEFIETLVSAFREVWRVLRPDGTVWLNIGDTYASDGGPGWQGKNGVRANRRFTGTRDTDAMREQARTAFKGVKPKDLMMIPARLALALQADGWWVRQEIIWHKPNPMPEPVKDRCTKSHEPIYLLAKSERYFFDWKAIEEPAATEDREKWPAGWGHGDEPRKPVEFSKSVGRSGNSKRRAASTRGVPVDDGGEPAGALASSVPWVGNTRNKRSVWTVPTQPFKEAHFATFPPALIEPCIQAGTSQAGCCDQCGAPWQRIVERAFVPQADVSEARGARGAEGTKPMDGSSNWQGQPRGTTMSETVGWEASCACDGGVAACVVLDPFGGAGTTGLVANRLGRDAVLVELKGDYALMAAQRIADAAPLLAQVTVE